MILLVQILYRLVIVVVQIVIIQIRNLKFQDLLEDYLYWYIYYN